MDSNIQKIFVTEIKQEPQEYDGATGILEIKEEGVAMDCIVFEEVEIKEEILPVEQRNDPLEQTRTAGNIPNRRTYSASNSTAPLSQCNCILERLWKDPFSKRGFYYRYDILKEGRPTPALKEGQFSQDLYTTIKWLCGCKHTQKVYCWPCVLFSPTTNSQWTRKGIDPRCAARLKSSHEISKEHIMSVISLITYDNNKTYTNSNDQQNVQTYNEKVKKNRHILNCLIDATCFLVLHEVPFTENEATGSNKDQTSYAGLLHLMAQKDDSLFNHLQTGVVPENSSSGDECFFAYSQRATVFQGSSSDVRNDVMDSIAEAMKIEITNEVGKTPFVTIKLVEVSDVNNTSQLVTLLRYLSSDGILCERFLRLDAADDYNTAATLAEHLFKTVGEFNCRNKLVAVTYDGSVVTAGNPSLREIVIARGPCPIVVDFYTHKLQKSVEEISECKMFFQTLSGIESFFSKSFESSNALDKLLAKTVRSSYSGGFLNSALVSFICTHRQELLDMLDSSIDNVSKWNGETHLSAKGFQSTLQEFDFNFLVNIFSKILPKLDAIFRMLESELFNVSGCLRNMNELKTELNKLRDCFDAIWSKTESETSECNLPRKKQLNQDGDRKKRYAFLFHKVVNTVSNNLVDMMNDCSHLEFLSLCCMESFTHHECRFPEALFASFKRLYKWHFDFSRLQNELSAMYCAKDFRSRSASTLMEFLISSGLTTALPEASKLLNLMLTIASSSSSEQKSSTMKTVQAYVKSSQSCKKIPGLAMMSIEKQLLTSMKQRVTFCDNVIKAFDKKNHRIDLNYK